MEGDEGFPDDREIWGVTHVCEEDLESTEGEGVDFLSELLELVGWPFGAGGMAWRSTTRRRRKSCQNYGLDDVLNYCDQHGLSFLINIEEPCDKQVHS